MSRTIAHQPPRVRLGDPALRIATHDHRNGTCDLPDPGGRTSGRTRCYWELDFRAAGPTCGCAMCTDQVWRRAERRRDRHRTREQLRAGSWEHL